MNRAQNRGTTVIATANEANSASTTASASAEKRNWLTPYRNVTGKNTTAVVRVAASTGKATSRPPFSAATTGVFAEFQMPVDVFEHHDGVIDQSRQCQRQPAQHHAVDGAAAERKRHERRQRRERNGEEDGDRGSHAPEEDQNHHRGQEQSDRAFVEQRANGGLHEAGLVEQHVGDEFLRRVHQVADNVANAVHHGDGVGVAALLENGRIDRPLAVHSHDAGQDLAGIFGIADVADADDGSAHDLERQLVDLFDAGELAVGVDAVVERADRHISGGQDQVRAVHGPDHVHQAELVRFQLVRVRIHHDLAIAAAKRLRNAGARHTGHLIADRELRQIAQLRFIEPFPAHGDQTNGQARGVELQHHRRQGAGRQAPQLRQGQVGNRGDRRVRVRPGLKIHSNHARARERPRLNVLDSARQRELPFEAAGNVGFDLLRRHAVIERRDHHHGDVDVREHVHRHARAERCRRPPR